MGLRRFIGEKVMKLSIIVPMHNSEKSIEKTILSALPYLRRQVEIILVDDGSTDSTKHVCNNYSNEFVKVIDNHHKKGVSGARNSGLDVAEGEYVTFLDSDDILASEMQEIVSFVEKLDTKAVDEEVKNPQIVLYGYEIRDNHGKIIKIVHPRLDGLLTSSEFVGKHLDDLMQRWLINPCWNKLYKKNFLMANEIRFSEGHDMAEDANFVLKCLECANWIQVLGKTGYVHCPHEGDRLTSGFRADKLDMQTENYVKYRGLHEKYPEFTMEAVDAQFYDDIQSYLDDAYYLSGYTLRQAKQVLRGILANDVQMSVIQTFLSNDWKQPFLRQKKMEVLHRKMAIRKWKGKISKWIRGIDGKKE